MEIISLARRGAAGFVGVAMLESFAELTLPSEFRLVEAQVGHTAHVEAVVLATGVLARWC